MHKYKVVYWNNGNKVVKIVEADSQYKALTQFYMTTAQDDIISITELTDDV